MGKHTFTRTAYEATRSGVATDSTYTARAELQFRKSKELNPLVDPKGFGVIRRSLPRFDPHGGKWKMTVGTPMPVEVRFDTTGSMGTNVQTAFDVLPDLYDLFKERVLARYDVQIAMGVFNDVCDQVVSCRSQFEMDQKIAEQLTYMIPLHGGGDAAEDPHYGLFGAAYLTAPYINRIGLKGYDFTISDATMHDRLDERTLVRVYGDEVFEKVAENGHQIDRHNLPDVHEMVSDLLTRTHTFFLQVGAQEHVTKQWTRIMGEGRVLVLPRTELLPQVISAIIGLTEGVIDLQTIKDFLQNNGVDKTDASKIVRSVAGIEIGAQAMLPGFNEIPRAGDIFAEKTDLWPVAHADEASTAVDPAEKESAVWL